MAADIEVRPKGPGSYTVTVRDGRGTSTHTVDVDPGHAERLTGGHLDATELVRRSFEFLLEREPKESILARFDLSVIQRYFPEYETDIRKRCARS